jgi:O-antigen/teichoic acid export membrane protein
MTDPSLPRRFSVRPGSGTTYMVVGTLVAAVAAYLFQLVAGRALGPTEFAPITVLWTIQFLVFTTVFIPMEQLTIRRLNAAISFAAPWKLFLWVMTAATLASVIFTAFTLDQLFAGDASYLPVTAVLILAYGGFALGRGFLAGRGRYRQYGLSTLSESVLRLALAVALLAAGAGAPGLAWSLVAGALVVWLWRPLHGERSLEAGMARERGTGGALTRFVVANGASQTILAAGPLVVGALGARPAEVSVFFETTLLFRAPLTIAYNLISRVLPPFTRMVERGESATLRRWAIRIGIGGALVAALGYIAGLALGPAAVELLLGAEFRPSDALAAYAAAGMAIATVALFAQQMLIAMRATSLLAGAWVTGLVTAAAVVWIGADDASLRVARAFLAGEAVAFVGIIAAVTTRRDEPAQRAP